MCVPGLATDKATFGMLDQASDHMGGQRTLAHIRQRLGVDEVVVVAGAQQLEEVETALGAGRAEPGEVGVANLGAEAVGGFVACAGVVHRNPGGARKPGAQYVASLGEKVVLAFDQEAEHLALADQDAEAAQQRHQSGHCHLPLMILSEHEAAQLRPEVTIDAVRQRSRHRAAIRHLPALATEIHDMPTDHQILHHKARVAFEARARRRGQLDVADLIDRQLRARAAAAALV